MAAKPRVLPPTSTKGLYVLIAALGLLVGVISSWITSWSEDALTSGGMALSRSWWLFIIAFAAFLLPAWLAGRVVARVHQQFLPNLLASLCYAPACVAGILCVVIHLHPEGLVAPMGQPLSLGLSTLIVIGICFYGALVAGILAAAFLTGYLTERFLGRRVIIQPGLICWVCGYNLGASSISICPECGVAFDPALPPRSASFDLLASLKRRRLWPLALGLLLALLPLIYTLTTHTIPSIRFLSACPSTGELRHIMNVNYITTPSSIGARSQFVRPLSHGWWFPDPLNPDEGISVVFYPQTPSSAPAMFISRGCLNDPSAAAGFPQPRESWWVYPGTENVTARLTEAQARQIITARAIPSPLIDAIRAKSVDLHWAPQSGTTKWPSGEQKVDATQFLDPPSTHSESPPP